MTRRLVTLAIFLLLGAVVNVAVAWLLAWCVPIRPQSYDWPQRRNVPRYIEGAVVWYVQTEWWSGRAVATSWLMWVNRDADDRLIVNDPEGDFVGSLTIKRNARIVHFGGNYPYTYSDEIDSQLVPSWSYPRRAHVRMGDSINQGITVDRAWGWPILAMRHETRLPARPRPSFSLQPTASGQLGSNAEMFLPNKPIWPSFALNTIFYAAILWPPIRGPFVLRRQIRRKRGLCVVCGYDLRHAEHDVCPECGARAATAMPSPLPR